MIKVTCEIEECSDKQKPSILIHNHWNENKKIELEIKGERYTVIGEELIQAIINCMNTKKF